MQIETIEFKDARYPAFQARGFAAKFAFPFAKEIIGDGKEGYDIGCNRIEWSYPGSYPIDPVIATSYDAMNLPKKVEYIFSSHALEHIPNWVSVLEYWASKIKRGGILFLYLPDYSQKYWRVWSNRKHIHTFTPEIIRDYLNDCGLFENIFVSGIDANNSFTAFCNVV